mmetsp:Transcript_27306/g.61042  ORF Transcript_27306/g.61042 Transcript_27306/m.61042 type:complete len:375 (-) Transcript_27306:229-1353(-)
MKLSEYEELRLSNIERNQGVLHGLGLDQGAVGPRLRRKVVSPKVKKPKEGRTTKPLRKSSRLVGVKAPNYREEILIGAPLPSGTLGGAPSSEEYSSDSSGEYEHPLPQPKARNSTSAAVKAAVIVPLGKEKFNPASVRAKFSGFPVAAGPVSRQGLAGAFKFCAAVDASEDEKRAVASFHPNRSPEEVLRAGAFGGTYFRTIKSGVVKRTLSGAWKELPPEWTKGLGQRQLSLPWNKYDTSANKFGVKSGTTLEDWESSGWITSYDPYGWFQWYCRFFQGRRCEDDGRQIGRWLKCCGPTGRWKGNLCGKVLVSSSTFDDPQVSPVVRQTLLHWGYELTEEDFLQAANKIGKKGAYLVSKSQIDAALKDKKRKR